MKYVAIAAAACVSVVVIASAQGAAAVAPAVGIYEAPLGGGNSLTFSYSTFRYPHVGFMAWVERRSDGSSLHHFFPGDALVHNGSFGFAGAYFTETLLASGEWIGSDVVRGTVTLPNGRHESYEAKLKLGSSGVFGLPPAQHGVHPVAGHYKAPYGGGKYIEFSYHSSHVHQFRAGNLHYFASAPVHGGVFTWRSHDHPGIRIAGHWTSTHDVIGEIFSHDNGAWEFHARLR